MRPGALTEVDAGLTVVLLLAKVALARTAEGQFVRSVKLSFGFGFLGIGHDFS